MPSAIRTQGVTMSLSTGAERVDILHGIDLTIEQGEFVALMGPSGSGKTTLLGLLGGLDQPTGGSIYWGDREISRLSETSLARLRNQTVGMIFQSFNLIPTLTAQENVEVPLYLARGNGLVPALRARELLELVGLGHRLRHKPSQLSGGEQQRVAIARALACQPRIVLGDEPTGNLDSANGRKVLDLLLELRETTRTTFVLATHDPSVAARVDRVISLEDGRVKEMRERELVAE